MFVIPNNTNNKPSTIITISVDINIISPTTHFFLVKRDARFEIL